MEVEDNILPRFDLLHPRRTAEPPGVVHEQVKEEDQDSKEDDNISIANRHSRPDYEEYDDIGIIEDEEEKGIIGFFRKTFSSVKKTFESTFNNKNYRAQSRPKSKMTGRSTPLLDRNDFDFGLKVANLEISPKIHKDRKERIEE